MRRRRQRQKSVKKMKRNTKYGKIGHFRNNKKCCEKWVGVHRSNAKISVVCLFPRARIFANDGSEKVWEQARCSDRRDRSQSPRYGRSGEDVYGFNRNLINLMKLFGQMKYTGDHCSREIWAAHNVQPTRLERHAYFMRPMVAAVVSCRGHVMFHSTRPNTKTFEKKKVVAWSNQHLRANSFI